MTGAPAEINETFPAVDPDSVDRAIMQMRLDGLKSEFEQGQEMIADLNDKRINIEMTLLRISGAIQVLEELTAPAQG